MYNYTPNSIKIKILILFIVQINVYGHAQPSDTTVTTPHLSQKPAKAAENYLHNAHKHATQGNTEKAIHLLDRAVSLQHDLSEAYQLRAKLRAKTGDTIGAITDYSAVIHLDPEYHEVRLQRGQIRMEVQQYALAIEDFEYLLHTESGITQQVMYRGSRTNGEFAASSATTLQSGMKPDLLNLIGLCLWHTGNYSSAIEHFNRAISLAPQQYEAYTNLGRTYETMGDTLEAVRTYQRVLALSPNEVAARNNLLSLARALEDSTLEQRVVSTMSDRYAYDALLQDGMFHLRRQQYDTAIHRLSAALDERVSAEALLQRGFAYEKTAQYAKATNDYNQAIRMVPSQSDGYAHRANVAFHEERYQAALSDYNRALSLAPDDATVYLNRGFTHQRLGHKEKACQDIKRAHELGLAAAARPLAKLCGQQ